MTVSSSNSRIAYTGNGSTTAFSFPYEFEAGSDLKVYQAGTLKTITTHYTVSGGSGSSGTVTFVAAPASNDSVVIYDDPPATQLLDYIANDPFPAESHEGGLDKLTRLVRRQKDQLARAVRLSDSDVSGASTILPTPSAQKVLGWNAAASALANYSTSDLVTIATYGAAQYQEFSGNAVTTAFTLSSDPGSVNNLDIDISGVSQRNGVDFTVSGTTLTFTSAPPTGTNNIHVKWMQALPQSITNANAVNFTPSGTGAVTRTVETKLREYVSALDFGAVADGDGAGGGTNNYSAFTAALAAITATGKPGVLHILPGTYRCDTGLAIDASLVSIVADGAFIDFSGMTQHSYALTLRGDGQGYAGSTYYAATNFIQGLRIKGKQGASEGAWPVAGQERRGIFIDKGTTNIVFAYEFRNCVITNFNFALWVADEVWGITFRNCNFFFNQTNVYLPPGTVASGASMRFYGCVIGNGATGFDIENTNASVFIHGGNVDGMQEHFFYITGGELSIEGAHIETGNDTACYILRRDSTNPTVYGSVSISNSLIIVKAARTVPIVDISGAAVVTISGGQIFADGATHTGCQLFDGGASGAGTLTILGTRLTKAGGDTVFGMAAGVELNVLWGNIAQQNRLSFLYGPATGGTSVSRELSAYDRGTFVPSPSNLTVVGTPSYEGKYVRIGDMVFGSIRIVNSGGSTTASTANSTKFTGLPYTPTVIQAASVITAVTGDQGTALVYTDGSVYTPTWAASGDDRVITFAYPVA